VVIVEHVNAALIRKIYSLCSDLLTTEEFGLPSPHDKFALPIHSEGTDNFIGAIWRGIDCCGLNRLLSQRKNPFSNLDER
jgi:hypothetical protein